jgi:hypothetical protein
VQQSLGNLRFLRTTDRLHLLHKSVLLRGRTSTESLRAWHQSRTSPVVVLILRDLRRASHILLPPLTQVARSPTETTSER